MDELQNASRLECYHSGREMDPQVAQDGEHSISDNTMQI